MQLPEQVQPLASHFYHRLLSGFLLTIVWMCLTLWFPLPFVAPTVSLFFLVLVPGYYLLRCFIGYKNTYKPARLLFYSVGLSLALLMASGLALNLVLLHAGNQQPFTRLNLTLLVAALSFGLILLASLRDRPRLAALSFRKMRRWLPSLRRFAFMAGLFLLPLFAVGGANTLNNGGSGWLALLTFCLMALVFLYMVWTNKEKAAALYPFALYCICLAILLGTSMRGWQITGHDVMQEYQVFELTLRHAYWSMKLYPDAYTACLSITILPTIFQKLTGIYDPYIYKFVFQTIFALVAPLLYTSLKDYVPRKAALLTVFIFITFPTFLTDIMMLNRQEIALLYFGLALSVAMDMALKRWQRDVLATLFLSSMVLSHYSTSYVAISILIVASCFGIGLRLIKLIRPLAKRLKFIRQPHFTLVRPYSLIFIIVLTFVWNGLYTNTAGNFAQTVQTIATSLPKLLHPTHSTNPKSSATTAHLSTLQQYTNLMVQQRPFTSTQYYSSAAVASSPVHELSQPLDPPTQLSRLLHIPAGLLAAFYNLARAGYVGLIGLLLVFGLVLAGVFHKTEKKFPTQYTLIGVASLFIIGMQAVLPSNAVDYGITRVIQQGLLILSLPAATGLLWLLGRLKLGRHWPPRLAALVLIGFFLIMSGVLPTLSGGFKPALALSNSGFYYEAYYTHQSEVEADMWLLNNTPIGSRVYSDEFTRRQLIAYAGIFSQPTLVPAAFPVDSYIYLSAGDTRFNEVPAYYNGSPIFYTIPYDFLNKNKTLVYNSGQVLIYK